MYPLNASVCKTVTDKKSSDLLFSDDLCASLDPKEYVRSSTKFTLTTRSTCTLALNYNKNEVIYVCMYNI